MKASLRFIIVLFSILFITPTAQADESKATEHTGDSQPIVREETIEWHPSVTSEPASNQPSLNEDQLEIEKWRRIMREEQTNNKLLKTPDEPITYSPPTDTTPIIEKEPRIEPPDELIDDDEKPTKMRPDNTGHTGEGLIIKVDLAKGILVLSRAGSTIVTYPVVLPLIKNYADFNLPATGSIRNVIIGAWWYPTTDTKATYWKKKHIRLPDRVPPGDKLNAMGEGKIEMQFNTGSNIPATVRIHGNAKEKDLHKRRSAGCIRMRNQNFLELASLIKSRNTQVYFYE
ncbi:MAG: L,D-transpeptidase [Candidatus Falkowbacteria bacterium]|nr:L,D-transpeptidase [Candidatus Falkowbacteria bacterium]